MKVLTSYELLNVGSHATISYKTIKYLLYEELGRIKYQCYATPGHGSCYEQRIFAFREICSLNENLIQKFEACHRDLRHSNHLLLLRFREVAHR